MNWLNKLEKRFGKIAIKNLMINIVSINAGVYVMLLVRPDLYDKLILNPSMIMKGGLETHHLCFYSTSSITFVDPSNFVHELFNWKFPRAGMGKL